MSQDRMQNNDSRQATPGMGSIPMPNVANVMARASRSLDKVRVSHGANEQYFDGITGKSVGQVRKSLREVFNIPGDAEAVVDGKAVGDDFVLQSGQHLEFSKAAGVKGKGDNAYTWTTLFCFILMVFGGLNTMVHLFTLHLIKGALYAALTVLWGFLFKLSLDRFNRAEQSSDH